MTMKDCEASQNANVRHSTDEDVPTSRQDQESIYTRSNAGMAFS